MASLLGIGNESPRSLLGLAGVTGSGTTVFFWSLPTIEQLLSKSLLRLTLNSLLAERASLL